jgi:hypothetical protein
MAPLEERETKGQSERQATTQTDSSIPWIISNSAAGRPAMIIRRVGSWLAGWLGLLGDAWTYV